MSKLTHLVAVEHGTSRSLLAITIYISLGQTCIVE